MAGLCLSCQKLHDKTVCEKSVEECAQICRYEILRGVVSCECYMSNNDEIESPAHYVDDRTIEPIEVIEDWLLSHHLACALKYISRVGRKNNDILDIDKAIWYLKRYKEKYCE